MQISGSVWLFITNLISNLCFKHQATFINTIYDIFKQPLSQELHTQFQVAFINSSFQFESLQIYV